MPEVVSINHDEFLSTLSLRRATCCTIAFTSPCYISIHALLTESDGIHNFLCYRIIIFLSTLSLRRATRWIRHTSCYQYISIHALLTESDNFEHSEPAKQVYFYPRSPYGERLNALQSRFASNLFLSTLSLRRATRNSHNINRGHNISIHALLTESDGYIGSNVPNFTRISIHALLTESDFAVGR